MLGPGGIAPKSCPGPKFLIGSIVISLSRCCLRNDEGPGPQIFFFLQPPVVVYVFGADVGDISPGYAAVRHPDLSLRLTEGGLRLGSGRIRAVILQLDESARSGN